MSTDPKLIHFGLRYHWKGAPGAGVSGQESNVRATDGKDLSGSELPYVIEPREPELFASRARLLSHSSNSNA